MRASDQQLLCVWSGHETGNAVPRETAFIGQPTRTRLLIVGSRQVPHEDPGRGPKPTPAALLLLCPIITLIVQQRRRRRLAAGGSERPSPTAPRRSSWTAAARVPGHHRDIRPGAGSNRATAEAGSRPARNARAGSPLLHPRLWGVAKPVH